MRRVCSILGRMIVALAGLSVVAAATNSNVVHAGGYNSADAPLIITIAVLLVAGMGTVGVAWRNGQRGSAFLLALFLLSGEAYWFGTNADREWKSRQEAEAPIAEAQLQRGNADRRLELALEAKRLPMLPRSPRPRSQGVARNAEFSCRARQKTRTPR